MTFEDQYQTVLYNIEAQIQGVYKERNHLLDYDVEVVVSKLIMDYQHEQKGKGNHLERTLANDDQKFLHAHLKAVCGFYLGSQALTEERKPIQYSDPLTLDEIITCLKRIHKSINTWTRENGRQGYLNFTRKFVLT